MSGFTEKDGAKMSYKKTHTSLEGVFYYLNQSFC